MCQRGSPAQERKKDFSVQLNGLLEVVGRAMRNILLSSLGAQ